MKLLNQFKNHFVNITKKEKLLRDLSIPKNNKSAKNTGAGGAILYVVHNSLVVPDFLRLLDGWRRGSTGWSLEEELCGTRARLTKPRPHVSASSVLPKASHVAIPSSPSKHPHRWKQVWALAHFVQRCAVAHVPHTLARQHAGSRKLSRSKSH